jgi:homocysteine S-methyltransferase
MGTLLYSRGVSLELPFEVLNVTDPLLVSLIHREYIEAGARLLETNTFRANRPCLAAKGLEKKVCEINQAGARLARKEAGADCFVAGSVGPLPRPRADQEDFRVKEKKVFYREQMEALAEGGADLLLLETFPSLKELDLAVSVAVNLKLPVIAQLAFMEGGRTLEGDTVEAVAKKLSGSGISVIGANCGTGPREMLDIARRFSISTRLPVSIFPNSGFPRLINGRNIYLTTPEYFALRGKELAGNGVSVIGGCCGTTPDHVRLLVQALRGIKPVRPLRVVSASPGKKPVKKREQLSTFLSKWGKEPVITVELDPPKGLDPGRVFGAAEALASKRISAISLAENPLARIRMGNIALAREVQEKTGLEVIVHLTGRDRNLIGLHSDLMGAHLLGIRNILAVTGDPTPLGNEAGASNVFDVTSIGLLKLISSLNEGKTLYGADLGAATSFLAGAALNPDEAGLGDQIDRLRKKIAAGARFVQTQPLFCPETLAELIKRTRSLKIPVLVGIMPLVSERNAEFLHNEVPGIEIPEGVRRRMRGKNGEEGVREGLAVARELIAAAGEDAGGFYLIPPFGKVDLALELIDFIRRN